MGNIFEKVVEKASEEVFCKDMKDEKEQTT